MSDKLRHGQRFWYKFDHVDTPYKHGPSPGIFIKYGMTEYTYFADFETFHKWFDEYREVCRLTGVAFSVYEMIMDGNPTAFYADVEGLSSPDESEEELFASRGIVVEAFRAAYAKMGGDPNGMVWTQIHRESGGKSKTSFHVVGRDLIFLDCKNNGSLHNFAKKINNIVTPRVLSRLSHAGRSLSFWSKKFKKESVLDMAVYNHKRPMRTVFSSKTPDSGGFALCDECNFLDTRSSFINLDVKSEELEVCKIVTCGSDAGDTPRRARAPASSRPPAPNIEAVVGTTPAQELAMARLKKILTEDYSHEVTRMAYTGVNGGFDQYRIDGVRECPVCPGVTHDSNGAYVKDLGNGEFAYKCLSSDGSPLAHVRSSAPVAIPDGHGKVEYLGSLEGIEEQCVVVCAGMGVGKTYRLIEFIRTIPPKASVLWLTPRVAMVMAIMTRLGGLGFISYKDPPFGGRVVMEFESLHTVGRYYDYIVLDEGRSLMASAVSVETNGPFLLNHINILQEQCRESKRTFIVGADINVDGAVSSFVEGVFPEERVLRINHTGGESAFLAKESLYAAMYRDITAEKRIMIACGSSMDVKEIEIGASRIIEGDENAKTSAKVGAYHAECAIKHELEDVNTTWEKYQVVLFTSTITVSVDYQGEFARVYSLPSSRTANAREQLQMEGRARNNRSQEIVVLYTGKNYPGPRPDDNDILFGKAMTKITTKRKHMVVKYEQDREVHRSVKIRGFGSKAVLTPTLATRETHKKIHNWYGAYLALLKAKGRAWTFEGYELPRKGVPDKEVCELDATRTLLKEEDRERVQRSKVKREEIRVLPLAGRKEERARLAEERKAVAGKLADNRRAKKAKREEIDRVTSMQNPYTKDARTRKLEIRELMVGELDDIDTRKMPAPDLKESFLKKINGCAESRDHAVLRKDNVQALFAGKLSGELVLFVEKNWHALRNRSLLARYPASVLGRVYAMEMELGVSVDFVRTDPQVIDLLGGIATFLGLESFHDPATFERSATDASEVESRLVRMDELTKAAHTCTDNLTRLCHYFKMTLGMNVSRKRTDKIVEGKRVQTPVYFLNDLLAEVLAMPNTVMGMEWLRRRCQAYDYLVLTKYGRHDNNELLSMLEENNLPG